MGKINADAAIQENAKAIANDTENGVLKNSAKDLAAIEFLD